MVTVDLLGFNPCASEALEALGPGSSLAVRCVNKALNRAWWEVTLRWLEAQLGDRGWLATDFYAWWRAAPKNRFGAGLRTRRHFEVLLEVFRGAARDAIREKLVPHLDQVAPLLQVSEPDDNVYENMSDRQSAPLASQYRQRLRRLRWRQLWEKVWANLCWMPAAWSAVSYRGDGNDRLLDERIMALKTRGTERYLHYHLDTAWDRLCSTAMPMECQFLAHSMPRAPPAFPMAPQLPPRHSVMRVFREGSRAFLRDTESPPPPPGLVRLYCLVAHRLPRYRGGRLQLAHGRHLFLERGHLIDSLQMVSRERDFVATLLVRHRAYHRKRPQVRRARLLVADPRQLPAFERMGAAYLRRCGAARGECVWCGRLDSRGMCADPARCLSLHTPN